MNEVVILKKFLRAVTPKMHKVRRASFTSCVSSLLNGAKASVTSMGRGISSSAYEKHRIKQADRLLSNKHIINEQLPIYQAIYTQYTNASSRPIILIDWSDLDTHKGCFLLRASVAFNGRGVAIYQEVHDMSTKEKRCTHKAFLAKLKTIIDDDAKPIIVTDAGYKTPWFKEVIALGWDFAGRVRKPMMYVNQKEDWEHTSELYKRATSQPIGFTSHICRSQPLACTLVLFKGKSKGRHSLTQHNIARQSKCSKVHARGATDPWLIATSLPRTKSLGKKIVAIYRLRMQIEEEFRDIKSSLFGLGFEHHKSRYIHRIAVLILIATLASILANIIGLAMFTAGLHRRYQANTVKVRRVLSFHYLGLRGFVDKHFKLLSEQFETAVLNIRTMIADNFND
ncbi:IS4 family transposase [Aliiglaciecola sp. LCG003]|uniref:IS4 family transposase n=1 Tax=Aliiglaciecola sp. LCG003 TaxID=3053655 RepID=UPI00257468E1|nr:IS4 family transposase [Aliiglaciecola sp. LCG003]WJG09733.1 IS4 family transposase [Aliiglaciecola sp. LCG003]WJG11041.1 IS4 family transposase [Aliiglaciecola sp. LCG003]